MDPTVEEQLKTVRRDLEDLSKKLARMAKDAKDKADAARGEQVEALRQKKEALGRRLERAKSASGEGARRVGSELEDAWLELERGVRAVADSLKHQRPERP